jgi:hypothetical protein
MKAISHNLLFWLVLVSGLALFSACGKSMEFHPSQPMGWAEQANFPPQFQGKWGLKGEFLFFITRKEIFMRNIGGAEISLDSLAKRGYSLRGDSLFRMKELDLEMITTGVQTQWRLPHNLMFLGKDSSLQDGLNLVYIHEGDFFHLAKFKDDGFLFVEDTLENSHPIHSLPAAITRDWYWMKEEFLGMIGDTVSEKLSKGKEVYLIHLGEETQRFVYQDSTSFFIENDSLKIREWGLIPLYQIDYNLVLKANEKYAFLNEPYRDGTWKLWVLHKPGPNQIRLLDIHRPAEIARQYFPVIDDSVDASGDEVYGYYASPSPEALLLFLQDDSLSWVDSLERIL